MASQLGQGINEQLVVRFTVPADDLNRSVRMGLAEELTDIRGRRDVGHDEDARLGEFAGLRLREMPLDFIRDAANIV